MIVPRRLVNTLEMEVGILAAAGSRRKRSPGWQCNTSAKRLLHTTDQCCRSIVSEQVSPETCGQWRASILKSQCGICLADRWITPATLSRASTPSLHAFAGKIVLQHQARQAQQEKARPLQRHQSVRKSYTLLLLAFDGAMAKELTIDLQGEQKDPG